MEELHRIVKPGGHVALTYPNMLSIGHAFSKLDVPVSLRHLARKLLGRSIANEKPAWVMDRTKYTAGQFNRMVGRIGFQTRNSVSLGYAPIHLLGRSILTQKSSLRLDNVLHRLAARPATGFLSRLGRTYLALVQKNPVTIADATTPAVVAGQGQHSRGGVREDQHVGVVPGDVLLGGAGEDVFGDLGIGLFQSRHRPLVSVLHQGQIAQVALGVQVLAKAKLPVGYLDNPAPAQYGFQANFGLSRQSSRQLEARPNQAAREGGDSRQGG